MKKEDFEAHLAWTAGEFQKISKKETVRIISHLDADGISACSIILKTLQNQDRNCLISILSQLNKANLRDLAKENYNAYVFTDLGSSQISLIEKYLAGRTVLILDHHTPEKTESCFYHANPHMFGIDGSKQVSGAGVVYLFCKAMNPEIKLAHLAIIGAIGDVQEENGFVGINKEIAEDAVRQGILDVSRGLKMFGRQTRPLHKLLEYNSDFKIPGVTGSEKGSLDFLRSIGIKTAVHRKWRRLVDLDEDELKRLTESIIIKRAGESSPESVIGPVYTLTNEKQGTPMRDAKEFATLLNACGRMKKASLGIGVCIGDDAIKRKAMQHVREYKKAIVDAMKWYRENKRNNIIEKGKNYLILNAGNSVPSTIIGTVASIISKSGEYEAGSYILSLARDSDEKTKVSLRMTGCPHTKLVDVIKTITKKTGGEAGGHSNAAGALIDTEKEEIFIEEAKKAFGMP